MLYRDLVTHMYGFVEKPTSHFCKFVAQRLILKYPFIKDGIGTGYVSKEKGPFDALKHFALFIRMDCLGRALP